MRVYRFWATSNLLLGAFGHHHNRQKIVHTRKSAGKTRRMGSSKKIVNWRRDGGTVSKIRWAFLVLWMVFQLLRAFGHHHNSRYKSVHTRTSTGKIRRIGLSKKIVNWRRDGGAVMCDDIFFLITSTSVGPRAPAGRPGSRQSGRWSYPAGLGHQKSRPGLDRPKSPRAARGPVGLLRPLVATDSSDAGLVQLTPVSYPLHGRAGVYLLLCMNYTTFGNSRGKGRHRGSGGTGGSGGGVSQSCIAPDK